MLLNLPAFKRSSALGHVIGWTLFLSLTLAFILNLRNHEVLPPKSLALPLCVFVLIYAGIFYLNQQLLLPRLFLKQKNMAYFAIVLLLFIAIFLIRPFDLMHETQHAQDLYTGAGADHSTVYQDPHHSHINYGRGWNTRIDFISIILLLVALSVSSGLQMARQWKITEQRAMKAEAEKSRAELSFLKAQIHPHFLFNTLNNIYSLALKKSEQAPASIMMLSQIMRYVTDDILKDNVPLDAEVSCIRNYIELNRLRLNSNARIDFSIEGDTEGLVVPPLVMMTFVENLFKYGISSLQPSPINIHIKTCRNQVQFYCSNKIFEQAPCNRKGVGIMNAQQRLEMLYPGSHQLLIARENGYFTVQLDLESA